MSVEDIEKAVEQLPADQLARFRAWCVAFDAARFDERIARDAAGARSDDLAADAIAEHRRGGSREL